MACRNLQKGGLVRNRILEEFSGKEDFVSLEELDLGSFDSVRQFADRLIQKNTRLNGLINCAGILNRRFNVTPDGFENTMEVNYIGTFLITKLLLPQLVPGSAITNVVSMVVNPRRINKDIFALSGKYTQLGSYVCSKTALLLFTISLAEKTQGIYFVNAADPGIVNTNILALHRWFDPLADVLFRPLVKPPQKGAIPLVNALLSEQSGKIFIRNENKSIAEKYVQHSLRDWLWNETEKRTAGYSG